MHRILKFEIVDQDAFRTTMRRLYPGFRYKTEDEALHRLLTGTQPIPVSQLGCQVRLVEPWEEPVEAHVLRLAEEGLSLRAIRQKLEQEHGIRLSHTRIGAIIREGREP